MGLLVGFQMHVSLILTGFLTDDLVSMENDGPHSKYLGVCRLPGDNYKVCLITATLHMLVFQLCSIFEKCMIMLL